MAFALVGLNTCGSGSDTVSCVVKVGGEQTNVSLNTKPGSSAVASVGAYSVAFSIQPGSHLRAEAKNAGGATLLTVTTGGVTAADRPVRPMADSTSPALPDRSGVSPVSRLTRDGTHSVTSTGSV